MEIWKDSIMAKWRNRPRHISHVKGDIPYILAIDESGSPSLKYTQKKLASGDETNCDLNNIHFNVTACLMKTSDFEESKDMVMKVKEDFWDEGCSVYKGDKRRVCFHSTEIRRRASAFNFETIDKHGEFIEALGNVMSNMKVKLFSSHIDKMLLVKEYPNPFNPYELALTFILERVSREVGESKAVIVLESRGRKEDKILLRHLIKMIDYGTFYHPKSSFNFIDGVYFNGKWDESADRLKSYWILEMADIYCYPLFKFGKLGEKDKTFNCIESKLYEYPYYLGRGFKKFPLIQHQPK